MGCPLYHCFITVSPWWHKRRTKSTYIFIFYLTTFLIMFSLLFPLLSSFAFPWNTLIISITDLLSWFIYNIKQTLGELFHRVQLVHIWVVKLMEISSQGPLYVVAFSYRGLKILLIFFSREDRILISLSTFLSSNLIILFRKRIIIRQLIAAGKRP